MALQPLVCQLVVEVPLIEGTANQKQPPPPAIPLDSSQPIITETTICNMIADMEERKDKT